MVCLTKTSWPVSRRCLIPDRNLGFLPNEPPGGFQSQEVQRHSQVIVCVVMLLAIGGLGHSAPVALAR